MTVLHPTDPQPALPGTAPGQHVPASDRRRPDEPLTRRILLALVHVAISVVAAVALWAAFVPWEELTQAGGHPPVMLRGLLLAGLVSGVLRACRVPWWGVLPLIALTGAGFLLDTVTGSPVPSAWAVDAVMDAFAHDRTAVARYSVPVAPEAGSLAVLLIVLALLLFLALDLLLVDRGWMMTGGLILLVVHLVPANLGPAPTWGDFALVAGCFVVLLALVQARTLVRWEVGTQHVEVPGEAPHGSSTPFPSSLVTGTVLTGGIAIVAAGVITSVVPLPADPLLDVGSGSGGQGQGEVTMANPLIDLRRDLSRGADVDLLTVSGGPKPTYVRTSVLTTYDGDQWSTGDRSAGRGQRADGEQSVPPGMSQQAFDRADEYTYRFTAAQRFRSRWLPLPEPASAVTADGDWRNDPLTRDFVAWEDDLDTAGQSWSATALVPSFDAQQLDNAQPATPPGGTMWTKLPDDFPQEVSDLAKEVAGDAPTGFQQARALQAWFRSEFTYSLERVDAVGDDDLLAFLSPAGRTGYCEQFSASMALMARSLGIPARVAVGFLSPDRRGDDWVFSAHDLHAWPELYFEGAGWVRFEPTPGSRSGGAPDYTRERLENDPATTSPTPSTSPTRSTSPTPSASPTPKPRNDARSQTDDGGSFPWTAFLSGLGALALVGGAVAPRLVRRRRHEARLATTSAEQRWAEVRDTCLDLGLSWPQGRSPRQAADAVRTHLGGADTTALDRLVDDVERQRYAADGQDVEPSATGDDLTSVLDTLAAGCSRGDRVRARWLPRSLFASV